MRILIQKNLVAHKPTNKLTSVIYALTLGCIIFLIEASNIEINVINGMNTQVGVDIKVTNIYWEYLQLDWWGLCLKDCLYPEYVDPILEKYQDNINSSGMTLMEMYRMMNNFPDTPTRPYCVV